MRMFHVNRLLAVLGFLSFAFGGIAQHSLFTQHRFHRLNDLQGLTNNVVNDIIQDTLGQVWVASNEGLFRYQGFEFQKFVKNKKNPNLIHNNFIGHLQLDKDNNVWLMTDDGVGKYSYEVDIISRYLPDQIYGRISSMAIDEAGNYYFGKFESGIAKVENDSVTSLNLYDRVSGIDFGELSITELAIAKNNLWAAASDLGIICYNLNDHSVAFFSAQEITGKSKIKTFDLLAGPEDTVWAGTDGGVYALHLDHSFSKAINKNLEHVLPQDDYLTIYIDGKENLWVGSRQNGLFTLSKGGNGDYELISHFTPSIDEYGISHRTISKIYQQKTGYFWLGTHNGGINVFNPNGEMIRTVTKRLNGSDHSLSYQSVWGICESSAGKIWVGTDGKGMSLLDPQTGKIENNAIGALEDKAVLCVHEDVQGRVWIGTYAHGVYLYDRKKDRLAQFAYNSPNSELHVNDIRCFYEDRSGKIYIGTNQGGLYSYDEITREIKMAKNVPLLDIRSIESVQDDILWLGTFGQGLLKFSVTKQKLIDSRWQENVIHSRDVVYDIVNDSGVFWVGTRRNGLVVFDVNAEEFLEMPVLEDLVDQLISGVQMDGKKNIWINTNSGVVLFNRQKNELQEFEVEDGFQVGHFNNGSIFYSEKDGYMAVGGIHGMNLFYPDELASEPQKENIILNQLKVFDKVTTPENSKIFPEGKSIFLTNEIHLNYSDNIFSIQYSLPGFTTHSKKDFIYMLEGYEEEWQYGAESNLATYRNVPPGHYQFRVKSLQNDSEKSLSIIISPPLWKTWQAYVFYTLAVLFLIWQWNKFSNSRVVLKQKLQFEQELREKEHAIMQEKLRFYTNFSHELKTPLTLIQGPVNDLLKTVEDPLQQQYLKLIRKNTGIILKFIRRMLEFRKIELNKTILNVGKHDLKILAQEEAESFSYLAKEKEVKFGFYCQNELEAWVDLEKMQIVIDNLLSNAFKFTPKGKTVNFGVYEHGPDLVIEVKDEGVGIKSDELKDIFSPFFQASNSYSSGGTGIGLTLCKNIVELHMGAIKMESQEGKGTKILVNIPKGKEKFGQKDYVRYIHVDQSEMGLIHLNDLNSIDENSIEIKDNEKLLLVVDDNKDITAYVKTLFDKEFKVLTADNGSDAYELAVNHTPDIIISDMMMPGMDGFELCEKIKTTISTSHIPVIMLTAKGSKEDKIAGYKIGADDYITKPFASEILIARVDNLLKSREMLELRYEANDLIDPQSDQNTREAEFVLNAESVILRMLEQSEFDIPMLCKELGMSQSALYRKIKSLTGVSIQIFIKKIRIKRAAQLLLSEDLTVTEIAFALNFSDLKYFRKCFKEQFDMTPSEYKAAYGPKPGDAKIEVDSL